MRQARLFKTVFAVLLLPVLNNCAASLSPIEVSERFWIAMQQRDAGTVRKYVSSESMDRNDLTNDILPLDSFSLGKTVIDGQKAWVDTKVVISDDKPFTLPLKTVLLQENNQWKVDYAATVAPISGSSDIARLLGSLNDLGLQFADKLDQSLGQLQNELPEIQKEIERIEENMKQKLPELQKKMEEFMRQLEEALGNRKQKQPSSGTREI